MKKLIFLVLVLFAVELCSATTIHVPSQQPTIQAGINAAINGDTVLVADGHYYERINFNGKSIVLTSEIILDGNPDHIHATIIDGDTTVLGVADMATVVRIESDEDSATVLRGFTIQRGIGTKYDQGQRRAGGIHCSGTSPRILDCTIRENTAYAGGAICIDGHAAPMVVRCDLDSNSASFVGGAVYDDQSSPIFIDCKFVGNTAPEGGALFSYLTDNPTFMGCTFSRNSSTWGGAIGFNSPGTLRCENCTFNQNASPSSTIRMFDGDFIFTNTTIISFTESGSAIVGSGTLSCCDLYGNQAGDWVGSIAGQFGINGNISADPLFCDIASGDLRIMASSPCAPENNSCAALIGACGVGCISFPYAISIDYGSPSSNDTVFTLTPQIIWIYHDSAATIQTGYEIEVGTDIDWGSAEKWSSGQISSADTSVVYAGLPLLNHQRYYLRIRLSNANGWGSWTQDSFLVRLFVIHIPIDKPTIQSGIDFSWDGDTVLVAPGTYYEHINFDGKAIVVRSSDGPDNTAITKIYDGLPIVQFQSGEDTLSVIEGFTIQNAVGVSGIEMGLSSSATVKNNIIRFNNDYGLGGGITTSGQFSKIISNTIYENTGGQNGAGIAVYQANNVLIQGNTIFSNHGSGDGGAICIGSSANVIVTNNVIYGNSIDQGRGVIYAWGSPNLTIINNTILNNSSNSSLGVGVTLAYLDHCNLTNNIIAFNSGGYGVHVNNCPDVHVTYCDVFQNQLGDYYGIIPGTGSISADPLFCDITIDNYSLASISPCAGTGEGGQNIGALGIGCDLPAPEMPQVTNIGIGDYADSLHVTEHSPVIAWQYYDPQSRPHTKSELEVGTDNDWEVAEMWQPPTIQGSDTSITYAGAPLMDGYTYYVRVRVYNDTLWGLWKVAPFRMNSIPTPPAPNSPANGSVVFTGRPTLKIYNALDAEGDQKRYNFEVYRDSNLTLLATYISNVVEGGGQTGWKTDSLTDENDRYWWRARASDGFENGLWSPVWSFILNAYNEPPGSFALQAPAHGTVVADYTPTFSWSPAPDPDPLASLSYTLYLSLDSSFNFVSEISGIVDTQHTYTGVLPTGTRYWWKVKALDEFDAFAMCYSPFSFWTMTCGDANGDHNANVSDAVFIINYVFAGGNPPNPMESGDANCDTHVNVSDAVWIINYVFASGPAPCDCGSK